MYMYFIYSLKIFLKIFHTQLIINSYCTIIFYLVFFFFNSYNFITFLFYILHSLILFVFLFLFFRNLIVPILYIYWFNLQ